MKKSPIANYWFEQKRLLSLTGCADVDCARQLFQAAPLLLPHRLDVSGCEWFTDKFATEIIAGVPWRQLKLLSVRRCKFFGWGGLNRFVEICPKLEAINLGGAVGAKNGLELLISLKRLRHFNADFMRLETEHIKTIGKLRNLQKLSVAGNKMLTNEDLGLLQTLRHLRSLNLNGCGSLMASSDTGAAEPDSISNAGIKEFVCKLTDSITDAGVNELVCKLTELVSLKLRQAGITDDCLESVKGLELLTHFDAGRTKITGEGFAWWADSQLRSLDVDCCNLTQKGIDEIGKISNLERLNLGSTPMNDAWILSLIRLVRLKHLDFSGCSGITGGGVRYLLRQLPYLEHLDLRGTGFTAKDQVELQKEFCHTKMVVGSTV